MRRSLLPLAVAAVAALVLGFGSYSPPARQMSRDGPDVAMTSLTPLSNSSAGVGDQATNNVSTVISSPANWVIARSVELEDNLRTGTAAAIATNPVLIMYTLVGLVLLAIALTASATIRGYLSASVAHVMGLLFGDNVADRFYTLCKRLTGTLGSMLRFVRALAAQLGGAAASSLRPIFGTFAVVAGIGVGMFAVFVGTGTGTAFAGNGGYLGQSDASCFPMWTLIVLALGSVVLVGGGLVTRRVGK